MALRETPVVIDGPAGRLQALYLEAVAPAGVALICHPHPQFAGTMQNKVVATLQRTARDLGWATLRFNFRGVGESEGSYGEGEGEILDALAAARWLRERYPDQPLTLLGFSFGACVAGCLGGLLEDEGVALRRLVMLAPPVERFDVDGRLPARCPLTVIQPEADEVVTPGEVYAWSQRLGRDHQLLKVPECSHFFHGKLVDLQDLLRPLLES